MTDAPPPGPAWDHAPTRAAVKRLRRTGRRFLAAAVVVLVAGSTIAGISSASDERVEREGERAVATVTGSSESGKFVWVEFDAEVGRVTKKLTMSDDAPWYEPGEPVEVAYDPADPQHAVIPGESSSSFWAVAAFVVLFAAAIVLLVLWGQRAIAARRVRRITRRAGWTAHPYVLAHGYVTMLGLLRDDAEPTMVALPEDAGPLELEDRGTVWVARGPGRRVALAAPGGAPVFVGRVPKDDWDHDRWRKQLPRKLRP